MGRILSISLALCGLLVVLQTPLHAQLNWSPITEESNITFQWVKPSFEGNADYSFLSANYYLGGRWHVKPGMFVLAEIPFVTYSYELDRGFFGKSEGYGTTFANPYIGIEAGPADRFFFAEFGLRIPAVDARTIDDNRRPIALSSGAIADLERISAFIDDYVPVRVTVNVQPWLIERTTRLRIKLGMWSYIPHVDHGENEMFLHWGFWLTHTDNNVHIGGGYIADYVTDDYYEFDEGVYHQLAFHAGMTFNKFTPSAMIRLPLNENLHKELNFALMLSASYTLD